MIDKKLILLRIVLVIFIIISIIQNDRLMKLDAQVKSINSQLDYVNGKLDEINSSLKN